MLAKKLFLNSPRPLHWRPLMLREKKDSRSTTVVFQVRSTSQKRLQLLFFAKEPSCTCCSLYPLVSLSFAHSFLHVSSYNDTRANIHFREIWCHDVLVFGVRARNSIRAALKLRKHIRKTSKKLYISSCYPLAGIQGTLARFMCLIHVRLPIPSTSANLYHACFEVGCQCSETFIDRHGGFHFVIYFYCVLLWFSVTRPMLSF